MGFRNFNFQNFKFQLRFVSFRLRTVCKLHEDIAVEAASLIQLFHGSDMPPYDIQERLAEWIERWENFKDIHKGSIDVFNSKVENDLVRKLKKEIDRVSFCTLSFVFRPLEVTVRL